MRLTRSLIPLTLAAAMLAAPRVSAYRPFDQTDADVVAYRGLELEVGPVAFQRSSEDLVLVAPSLIVNYGIRPRVELVIEGKNERSLHASVDRRWRPQDFAASV